MDILFTGRLGTVTEDMLWKISTRHKPVFISDDVNEKLISSKTERVIISQRDESFEKIFDSYNFGAVVFFSQQPGDRDVYYDEFRDLECTLRMCAEHDVNNIIYVSSTAVFAGADDNGKLNDGESVPMDCTGVMFSSCEDLCKFYRERKALSIVVVRIPCMYGIGETGSLVGNAIEQCVSDSAIKFRGAEEQVCDFVSQRDFGELLSRMIDDWCVRYSSVNVIGGSALSFKQLGEVLKLHFPTLRLSYSQSYLPISKPVGESVLRDEYDWIAVDKVENDIPGLIKTIKANYDVVKNTVWSRIAEFFERHSFIVRVVELLLGFLLMEFLNYATDTTIQFQYIDYRLLYVVIFSIAYGVKVGFTSAALACASLLLSYSIVEGGVFTILYNVDNWLPFIAYIVIAGAIGYTKDKLKNDNKSLTDEKKILEDRYMVLNEFYGSALQNKGQYKNQIMSYRDSFGRFFEITKKLDREVAEDVFNKALQAMEEVLENQSICIYSCDERASFARLVVCSNKISNITEKSLSLDNFETMMNELEVDQVWTNKNRLLGYPEYAFPIYHDEILVALIIIQKAKYEQLAIYYENLIKVICGLVRISLVRAIEYTDKIQDEMYIPGTRIMREEPFKKVVAVKDEMSALGTSEYALIKFDTNEDNLMDVADVVASKIRNTDVMGIGDDGELYLCLSQAGQNNVDIVLRRITQSGIEFNQMDEENSMREE